MRFPAPEFFGGIFFFFKVPMRLLAPECFGGFMDSSNCNGRLEVSLEYHGSGEFIVNEISVIGSYMEKTSK